jgi:hypothetical protein
MSGNRWAWRALAGLLLLLPGVAAGQGTGLAAVRGVVTDSLGQPVEQARIQLIHSPTGSTLAGYTASDGRYHLLNVQPGGPYAVVVVRLGYGEWRTDGLQLQAGTTARVDVALATAAIALPMLEVRVPGDARFDPGRTGAATIVTSEVVALQPTIARNVAELTALSPLAASTRDGMAIAGQNTRFNAFRIDGGTYQDLFGYAADGLPGSAANALPLPLKAVDQFQVLVAPFDVRQSGFTGGVLNVVTRRGTNEWEASAFGHYRDRSLFGELDVAGLAARPARFENQAAGFAAGGPLRRDRIHLFVAAELERLTSSASGYHLGEAGADFVRLLPDSVARAAAVLREVHGFADTRFDVPTLGSPRENVFARLDWQLGGGHRLLLRHNVAAARRDVAPNRAAHGAYEFTSHAYEHRARAHAGSAQLLSAVGGFSNELLLNVQLLSDRASPHSTDPVVEVALPTGMSAFETQRRIRAGGHLEAQANRLAQRSLEVRNALTRALGEGHVLTVGAALELMHFEHLYLPNARGLYRFESLEALERNEPYAFERTLVTGQGDGSVRFPVSQFSAFVQDEWTPLPGLTLHGGVRLDAPRLGRAPAHNDALFGALGVATSTLPEAGVLWSPRVAFNWQSPWRHRTQLRGGAGIFTGRPAYAWLASAYAQTGLDVAVLRCTGEQPALGEVQECPGGARATQLAAGPVTVFSPRFRLPQDLRLAFGLDQVLPHRWTASADVVFTRARNQVFMEEVNLAAPVAEPRPEQGYSDGFGFPARTAFGRATVWGFEPLRRTNDFTQVARLTNRGENRALAASFELEGAVLGVGLRGAYAYTRSIDTQSLTRRDPAGNIGATATAGDPNEPHPSYSDFDRPHRVLAAATARTRRLGGTSELSLLYIGESGAPYSYVYSIDINGDGYPGTGSLDAYNDLVAVPWGAEDFPGGLASVRTFLALAAMEPCLWANRGGIAARNDCRTPFTHRLDLRLAQGIGVAGRQLRLTADVLNVLHLLGSDRGRVVRADPLIPILDVVVPRTGNVLSPGAATAPLEAWYAGAIVRDGHGRVVPVLPHTVDMTASQWQAQFGLEIRW